MLEQIRWVTMSMETHAIAKIGKKKCTHMQNTHTYKHVHTHTNTQAKTHTNAQTQSKDVENNLKHVIKTSIQ